MTSKRARRAGLAVAVAAVGAIVGLAVTPSFADPATPVPGPIGDQPGDPAPQHQPRIPTAPCDPGGERPADGTMADQLNPQLNNTMRGHMNSYKVSCVRVIAQTVRDRGLNPRAAAIAIATVIVETTINNYSEAVDHDSLGLYQQRPSQGWCQPVQCIDPVFATNAFLNVMEQFYPNGSWNTAPIGDVAADVQRPADEFRYRYAREAADATVIADAMWNNSGASRHPYASGRVVSARSADGRLETFTAGADGVHHAYQTRVNGDWSAWRPLGGPRNAHLAIAPNADGRLELFAVSGQTLDHIWQTRPAGEWSGWANFGGPGYRIAAGTNADGRVEVFASNETGVFHKWQTGPTTWSEWEGTHGGPANSRLAMENAPDGRLEVFALSDNTFEHLYQMRPNGGWSAWENFGTGGRDVALSHNQDGRLEVFASNGNGVFHRWQTSHTTWSEWEGAGGIANAELAASRSIDGRVEIFAINADTASHIWQRRPNAPYTAWESFGTGGTEIVASNNADGRMEVFGTSRAGIFHKWQTGFSTWSAWAWLADSAGPSIE
ncbi:hypothetical protein EV193_106220 [Herbihabitans rhizosphaerae]|uniref:PLL-like beta propeller domain-containing protein n=1 Tax=Herbihabitans rhizosphaerae TaxID=1872711 RepID=A0A4Q7KKI5_9PSEU|nr:VCBS repeat-containing protein [Herbihabitans rhizosphaerae]RZS36985.1 hypothetical protein EV193_106220 [Herbihabitans rhizosphaerae]